MGFSIAERMGNVVGNSLVSKGLIKMEGDTEVVDDIVAFRSADLVSDPASAKGLFESIGVGTGGDESVAQLRLPDGWQESGGSYVHAEHGKLTTNRSGVWHHRGQDGKILRSGGPPRLLSK